MALQTVFLGAIIGVIFFRLQESPKDIQSLKNLSYQLAPTYF